MKKTKRLLALFMAILLSLFVFTNNDKQLNINAQNVKDEREFKAVWMSTFVGEAPYQNEIQFKNDMNDALDILEYYGLNALIFHVRTHNNAFYKSRLNPVASWWAGADFDVFDPLGWLIDETHSRGIEFHAWMNPYRVSEERQVGNLSLENPQSDPSNLIIESGATILNPSLPIVKQHIYDTITEFAEIYPTVDAVHFDDYFYINTGASPTSADARRNHITEMIEGVKNALTIFNEENNTTMQFGISPTGIYRNGSGVVTYDTNGNPITNGSPTNGFEHYGAYLYADTVKWSIDGSIDYLIPQTYWPRNRTVAKYEPLMNWWNDVFRNLDVNLYSGIGVYQADGTSGYGWSDDMNELKAQFAIMDNLNKVDGYSIYSFKHLKYGYTNSQLLSGQQIRNGYSDEIRRAVKVLPELRNFTPKYVDSVKSIRHANNLLTWENVSGAKFYYIYKSDFELTYSSDEIIDVVGQQEGLMNFDTTNFGSGNYGVRALSQTNHLSEVSKENILDPVIVSFDLGYDGKTPNAIIIEKGATIEKPGNPNRDGYKFLGWYLNGNLFNFNTVVSSDIKLTAQWEKYTLYNISYNLNGGSLITGYQERDKMIDDFLKDYYNFVNPEIDLNTFMHGAGKTSGYDGLFNELEYFSLLYEESNKAVEPSTGKFINQIEYNKWVPLFDLIDEYTHTGNNNQHFWTNPLDVGPFRIKPFIQKVNLWNYRADEIILEIVNRIPSELNNIPVTSEYTEIYPEINLPKALKEGFEFLGWYDNPYFIGSSLKVIPAGSKGDVSLYARWLSLENDEVIVYFDLNYSGLSLPTQVINTGQRVITPKDPLRQGFEFLGWHLNEELYDFNNYVTKDIILIAQWKPLETQFEDVTVYFDLGYDEQWLPNIVLTHGARLSNPYNPVREGYEFLGWYLNNELYKFNERITNNIKLTAKWKTDGTIEIVTLDFNLGYNDLTLPSITTEKGLIIENPYKPTREGYLFSGWYYGQMEFDFIDPVYDDYSLVANWKEAISVDNYLEVIDGASIRTLLHDNLQRLRFYGRIDSSLLESEFGFYAIFGTTTSSELKAKILESNGKTIYINDQIVLKNKISIANDKNEFTIVLTGIPEVGYTDKITVVAYAVDEEGKLYLSENVSTRSVLDVAYKMSVANSSNTQSLAVLNYVHNKIKKLDYDAYGNLRISKGLYETSHIPLKNQFFADWNDFFGTNLINPTAEDFFTNAKLGSDVGDRNATNIGPTNIYKFFNDSFYGDKWGWLLDYMEKVDYTIHATGQIQAIKGNGTYNNPNLGSNNNRLYNASHLVYSIYNFFNETEERGRYTAIDFNSLTPHNSDNMNKQDRYSYVEDYNDKIYIDVNAHKLLKTGETITLPIIDQTPPSGLEYVYFDGEKYIAPLGAYKVSGEVVFEVRPIEVSSYVITFYDGNDELKDLKDYYIKSQGKELPVIKKDNYLFLGWYDNPNFTGSIYTIISPGTTGTKSFYAKWEYA